jgi:hypothetical protein
MKLKQILKQRYLKWQRERGYKKHPPPSRDPWEDEGRDREPKPDETVGITVPIADEYGVQYGARTEFVTPETAARMMEDYRQSMVSRGKALWEKKMMLKLISFLNILFVIAIGVLIILILFLIM